MSKNFGAFLAISIAFGAHGATAASISEARLQHLMSSTAQESVALETLRARDRDILRELAGSLADRYADLLAGGEMVFSRVSENGTLFYRLDFVNLRNRDRARALCEILEMDRCIATLGSDRMVVLDVGGDEHVTAIARIENDADVFAIAETEPRPEANPQAREVEAKVRGMLDPLGTFPVKRPAFDRPESAAKPAQGAGSDPDATEPTATEPTLDDSIENTASMGTLPRPRARPQTAETDKPSSALQGGGARAAKPSAEDEARFAPKRRATALASLKMIPETHKEDTSRGFSPLMRGVGAAGMIEVAGLLDMAEASPARVSPVDSVRIPGLGVLEIADSAVDGPRIRLSRSTFPKPAVTETSVAALDTSSAPDPIIVAPVTRDAALEDLAVRRAVAAAQDAPLPRPRMLALADIAPDVTPQAPSVMQAAPNPDILDFDIQGFEKGPKLAAAPALEGNRVEDMMVADAGLLNIDTTPAKQPTRVAAASEEPKTDPKMVQDFVVAGDIPRVEGNISVRRDVDARDVISDLSRTTRLAKVIFDDRYARPAVIDFTDGKASGRLQKLPMKRDGVLSRARATRMLSAPLNINEDEVALLARESGPFEVAQVPKAPEKSGDSSTQSAPEKTEEDARNRLDMLLSGEVTPRPSMEADADRNPQDSQSEAEAAAANKPAMQDRPSLRPGTQKTTSQTESVAPMPKPQVPTPESEVRDLDVIEEDSKEAESEIDQGGKQARRAQALEALTQIIEERRTTQPREPEASPDRMEQAADRQVRESRAWQSEQDQAREDEQPHTAAPMGRSAKTYVSSQRRPAPRVALNGNMDLRAAQERAGGEYVAGNNDLSDMQRRAQPRENGLISRVSTSPSPEALAPASLRIELSYVGSRDNVMPRVEELKAFFPPVMLKKGRFFGASVPEQPNRFMVGIAAHDAASREDLIWYLEQMGMPWAVR